MQLIKVLKITLESYNELVDAGYKVQFVGNNTKLPYANYKYVRPQEPKKLVKPLTRANDTKGCYINWKRDNK